MVRWFCLIALFIGFGNAGMIEPALLEQMEKVDDATRLPVMIALREQFDGVTVINTIKNKRQRWETTVSGLKRMAEVEQAGLLAELQLLAAQGKVSSITPLWIVNAVYCEATPDVIREVADRPEVWFVQWDLIPTENALGVASNEPASDAIDGSFTISWNVRKVKADSVWFTYGYMGDSVVIGNIDTGCDYNHPDLASHMWTDPNYPYHGWNFEQNNNNPMDQHGHGTHTCGTNAGDGTSGETTGMAPKALIMVCRTKTSLNPPLPDTIAENTVMNSMQFCVAPPLSPHNHAHVLSMSLGWLHSWNPRRALWRLSVTNVAAAGLAYCIANGNEGSSSPPDNVRTPGDCPGPWKHPAEPAGGQSGAISIGATDANDNIASFSSWGPVSWSNIDPYNDYPYPPGLFKPDVSAPGVNVTSTRLGGGYTQMSGTSMATPCAAGVIALMLSKNPELLPEEVDSILQMSVLPLGSRPKNNTFGTGRVDAMRAIEMTPFPGPRHDIGIGKILAPPDTIYPEQPLTPIVVVENKGDFVETNVQVHCKVDSAGQQVYHADVTIPVMDTAAVETVRFSDWAVGPGGNTYRLTFYHSYRPDTVPRNDTAKMTTFALNHDIEATATNIGAQVRASRPTQPSLTLTNVGGYREQDFWTYCRIESAGTVVYHESLHVDTLGLGRVRTLLFPTWNVGPVNIVYRVALWHGCAPDRIRGNDTIRVTTTASVSMLRVAIEVAERSIGRTRPNACYVIDSLCRAWGWTSAIVKGTEIDEWNELNNYDVVVTGDVGTADNDFDTYDNFLLRWVRSGGGFVGLGWAVFGTYLGPGPWSAMDSLSPVMAYNDYGFVSGGAVTFPDTSHPVVRGMRSFNVQEYGEYAQAGAWPEAQVLGGYSVAPGRVAVACKEPGRGRSVYLGPIYFGDFSMHNNEPYYQDPYAVRLLRQAMEWAASGPGAGVETPGGFAPEQPKFTHVLPNPARFLTRIGYSLQSPGRLQLAVYDLAGKRVRTLFSGVAPAGSGEVSWNLTDDVNRVVPKGIYFCRLETENGSDALKVIVR